MYQTPPMFPHRMFGVSIVALLGIFFFFAPLHANDVFTKTSRAPLRKVLPQANIVFEGVVQKILMTGVLEEVVPFVHTTQFRLHQTQSIKGSIPPTLEFFYNTRIKKDLPLLGKKYLLAAKCLRVKGRPQPNCQLLELWPATAALLQKARALLAKLPPKHSLPPPRQTPPKRRLQ